MTGLSSYWRTAFFFFVDGEDKVLIEGRYLLFCVCAISWVPGFLEGLGSARLFPDMNSNRVRCS